MASTSVDDLLEIMALLRDPQKGCPWDLKQTLQTIVPHTIEEAYEVADAIESGNVTDIMVEIGDLLLQIVFYCQIAKENNWFNFFDVVDKLKNKLVERHPHVFSQRMELSAQEHKQLWNDLKAQERQKKLGEKNRVLADVPRNLPALTRAQKLQARAAQVGFDWPHLNAVLDKLKEEVDELSDSCVAADPVEMQAELGDILFVCANIARHLQWDAEMIMRQANQKFEKRFNAVEEKVVRSGENWQNFSLAQLEEFWQQVKAQEKQ